jgi:hypothetical protein
MDKKKIVKQIMLDVSYMIDGEVGKVQVTHNAKSVYGNNGNNFGPYFCCYEMRRKWIKEDVRTKIIRER